MAIFVIEELCDGCSLCLKNCQFNAIQIVNHKAQIGLECIFCKLCIENCPKNAIKLDTGEKACHDIAGDIWVYLERNHKNNIDNSSLEIISKMKQLNPIPNRKIYGIIIGSGLTEEEKRNMALAGADCIYQISLPNLTYSTISYSLILKEACNLKKPFLFLFSATELGRDLAPRLATLLETGLTADCTELSIDKQSGLLVQTRPAFSGDLMASIICPKNRPQMATIRPHSFVIDQMNTSLMITCENLEIKDFIPSSVIDSVQLIQRSPIRSEYPLIEEQKIVISVGRGIGNIENLKLIESFAKSLHAGIGCSRPIVDAGWLPVELQVGMSGKSIAPKLYIALGISGSVQHLVGIQSAEYIIAVNRDENAPIFKVAQLGIVGDIKDMLPEIKKLILKDESA